MFVYGVHCWPKRCNAIHDCFIKFPNEELVRMVFLNDWYQIATVFRSINIKVTRFYILKKRYNLKMSNGVQFTKLLRNFQIFQRRRCLQKRLTSLHSPLRSLLVSCLTISLASPQPQGKLLLTQPRLQREEEKNSDRHCCLPAMIVVACRLTLFLSVYSPQSTFPST